MFDRIEQERLKSFLSKSSKDRNWAAEEFDAAQKQVLVDRSTFFDKLALFHSGTIAATISFAGILHQIPHWSIQWKKCLFASWIALFLAMVGAMARNWQGQNSWFHTTASVYEKYEGELSEAYGMLITRGDRIVDRKTGELQDPTKISAEALKALHARKERSADHKRKADRAEKLRVAFEKAALILTVIGIALALTFAMRNFS